MNKRFTKYVAVFLCVLTLFLTACGVQREESESTGEKTVSTSEADTSMTEEASSSKDYSDYEKHELDNGLWLISKDYQEMVIMGNGEIWIDEAWHEYDNLIEKVIVEEGVTMISAGASYPEIGFMPSGVKEVQLPESLEKVGATAFLNCARLEKLTIPEKVQYIQERAFKNCSGLKELILPKQLQFIGARTFEGCSSLKEITIPGSVKTFEDNVFFNCKKLEKVVIVSGVERIGTMAFSQCDALKEIYIPKTCKELIGIGVGENAELYFEGDADNWKSILGIEKLPENYHFDASK